MAKGFGPNIHKSIKISDVFPEEAPVAGALGPGGVGHGLVNDGSIGSLTSESLSQPSCSRTMDSIATWVLLALNSFRGLYFEGQQRNTFHAITRWPAA